MTIYVSRATIEAGELLLREMDQRMRQTTLHLDDREHHKELLDLNLVVTINDDYDPPAWLADFIQKNIAKYQPS